MNFKTRTAFILLPGRLLLFLLVQLCFALLLGSFKHSANYWIATATITNFISIAALVYLFKIQGMRFRDLFRFDQVALKKDILIFFSITLFCIPIVFLPNYYLSIWFWGNEEIPYNMMFKPMPLYLVYSFFVLFPITTALGELSTYFGYIMPGLKEYFQRKWLTITLPVFFLAVQHCTLPFIPDIKFIMYRALMYFPFACVIGISLYKRPGLFPYFAILHGMLDFATVMVLLNISTG